MRRRSMSRGLQTLSGEEARRVADYFGKRASRANIGQAKRILKRAGKRKPPAAGDDI